jgi:hypothetical protein
MTGLSRAQVTRLIAGYAGTGHVEAVPYRCRKFAKRYTKADVELLAHVDKSHGNLSGSATTRLLQKLLIEQTKSRAHRTGDNGLVESKNGAIIRKHMGFSHIAAPHAEEVDRFHREHLNPYVTSTGPVRSRRLSNNPTANGGGFTANGPHRWKSSARHRNARPFYGPASAWSNWKTSHRISPTPKLPLQCNKPKSDC